MRENDKNDIRIFSTIFHLNSTCVLRIRVISIYNQIPCTLLVYLKKTSMFLFVFSSKMDLTLYLAGFFMYVRLAGGGVKTTPPLVYFRKNNRDVIKSGTKLRLYV